MDPWCGREEVEGRWEECSRVAEVVVAVAAVEARRIAWVRAEVDRVEVEVEVEQGSRGAERGSRRSRRVEVGRRNKEAPERRRDCERRCAGADGVGRECRVRAVGRVGD